MNNLVKFAMVSSLIEIKNNYKYIENKVEDITSELNIDSKDYILEEVELSDKVSLDNGTHYCLTFSYDDNKYNIDFIFETYNNVKQLEVNISSNIKEEELTWNTVNKTKNFVEQLKISIKNNLFYSNYENKEKEWNKCIWLIDKQSQIYASHLYPKIYTSENLYIEFINSIMVKVFGANWWNDILPKNINKIDTSKIRDYKSRVPSLNDVDETLMSVDTSVLLKIIQLEIFKWECKEDKEIEDILIVLKSELKINGIKKIEEKQIKRTLELLVSQLREDDNLWKRYFSKYLSSEFINNTKVFIKDRNHIAHNKLVDRQAYESINKNINLICGELENALNQFSIDHKSLEIKDLIRLEKEYDIKEQEQILIDFMEQESGIEIRDEDSIYEIFEDAIFRLNEEIIDGLRFRKDIKVENISDFIHEPEEQVLFKIKNLVNKQEIIISCSTSIDCSQGERSELNITAKYDGMISKNYEIPYTNGEVSFDDEQCTYMPEVEDEFGEEQLENAIYSIIDFVNDNLENIREKVDNSMYRIIKDGGSSPVADGIYCWNCREEYISINENYGEIGQCLNCGEINDIYECEICGNYVDELTELERCYGCTPKDFFKD